MYRLLVSIFPHLDPNFMLEVTDPVMREIVEDSARCYDLDLRNAACKVWEAALHHICSKSLGLTRCSF